MSLVVFQKIFFSVWKMLQGKRQNQKNKHSTQIYARDRLGSTARRRDRDRRRDLAKHRADRDRREGEFVISNRDRRRWCLRTAPTGYASPSRALSLSLSLSLSGIHLK